MKNRIEDLLGILAERGICSSRELRDVLGSSQSTMSRLLKHAGDQIVRIGSTRNARYFRPDNLCNRSPLFRISEQGVPEHLADVYAIMGDGFYVHALSEEFWLNGEGGDGVYPGLPYFLDDLRPQGFIGRQIARAMGVPYPHDPRKWNDDQVLSWLIDSGFDLPGDLVLGEKALAHSGEEASAVDDTDYPRLADMAVSGTKAGSSAGGEQPKFVTRSAARGDIIVKFSARGNDVVTRRWRDILIAENHALVTLTTHGIAASSSRIIERDDRTFLESQRFDRAQASGRKPMLSMAAVDAEFVGEGRDWVASMEKLFKQRMVSEEDLHRVIFLQLFGSWIGNSDMHLGNLSLYPTEEGFAVAPAYDMAPMLWAPVGTEVVPGRCLTPPVRDPRYQEMWRDSALLALEFWRRIESDNRVSESFHEIASESVALIRKRSA